MPKSYYEGKVQMKKRQIKKNEKLHVKVVADEYNLMLLNDEDRKVALDKYLQYRWSLAKMPYRQLKRIKLQHYFEAPAVKVLKFGKVQSGKSTSISQSLEGIDQETLKHLEKLYGSR